MLLVVLAGTADQLDELVAAAPSASIDSTIAIEITASAQTSATGRLVGPLRCMP